MCQDETHQTRSSATSMAPSRAAAAKAKTEFKQKIMDFYNRSVTARRGHKKRLAQPGYPNLRAIFAWDQALQSATRGLGLAAFQVQKPVPVEQNQKRVFIAMEDLLHALQTHANGRKKRALCKQHSPAAHQSYISKWIGHAAAP